MSRILTYISVNGDSITRSSLEVLSYARSLCEKHGWKNTALVVHETPERFADTLKSHGADIIFTIASPGFARHRNRPVIDALETAIAYIRPRITAFASSEAVKDVIGAAAVRTGAAVIPEVTGFSIDGEKVTASRMMMASRVMADMSSDAETVLISVRAGSFDAVETAGEGKVEAIPFEHDESAVKAVLKEITGASGDAVDLTEADVVVAAGRGVKDENGKKLVEELAEVTGAAIGASRAVVESGLFPATSQIGQTGKVVSPTLYFAVGISGAIQHTAGMSNSKVIVAINKDADAPIFDIATYGLAGDLYKILPPLIKGIRDAKSRKK